MIAGINASLLIDKKAPFVLGREEAYLGVLIDDLITKDTDEPYRMFTSRAEHRLLLRYDNAHFRLAEKGYSLGLTSELLFTRVVRDKALAARAEAFFETFFVSPETISALIPVQAPVKESQSIANLLRRPHVLIAQLESVLPEWINTLATPLLNLIATNTKYRGYIDRERLQVERLSKHQNMAIPASMNYTSMAAISFEARQKLQRIQPETIGQASRISGVSPADVSILLILLKKVVSRETT